MKPKTDVSNTSIDEVSIDFEDSPTLTLIELFHDPAGTTYATIATDSATLTVPVKSEAYKSFIRQQAFQAGDTLKQTEVRERTDRDSDEARFNGMEHEVYIRVGRYDGHVMTGLKAKAEPRLFIDLADDGRACEVTSSGWTVVTHPACKFWRAAGMLPLSNPRDNFELMIHELAHNTLNSNAHLKDIFYKTEEEIAGKLMVLALEEPELFERQTENGETYSFTAAQPIWDAAADVHEVAADAHTKAASGD